MRAVIAERDFTRVVDLSEMFGISEVTVRSDLDTLATRGHVRRVRGGAVSRSPGPERPFEEAETSHAAEKAAIGRAAAAMVDNGDTVILD
ncbi:MAG: DeoR/GlpR transcriptional regulator, partial [Euzebyales bacterium]|nr:DeoR/GlpR transcriptional regulator [Euzebyales bacterium]